MSQQADKEITFIYTYYDNPLMLAEQYRIWESYPESLKDKISIILVDDASPTWPASDVIRVSIPDISIYRVSVDIPWHQDGARNLGAHEAEEGLLFLSDMDHALPGASLAGLLQAYKRHDMRKTFFAFPRLDMPYLKPVKKGPGANILALTKKLYWDKMKGYDEDLCGQYGSDAEPRKRLMKHARRVILGECPVIRYNTDVISDAHTTAWERRGPEQDRRRQEVLSRKQSLGREGKITHLDFNWSRVL